MAWACYIEAELRMIMADWLGLSYGIYGDYDAGPIRC